MTLSERKAVAVAARSTGPLVSSKFQMFAVTVIATRSKPLASYMLSPGTLVTNTKDILLCV